MTFEKLLEKLGESLGVEIENAGGAAAVDVDGTTVVLQDADGFLLMRAVVGELPQEKKAAILASAMEANFLYQGTGGATLAVNPSDGMLHIHKYDWMERFDAGEVLEKIGKLADTVAGWRKILADCYLDEGDAGESPVDLQGQSLRV